MHDLLPMTAKRALHYLDSLNKRTVMPSPEALARLAELGGPLPDGPTDSAEVVALLDRIGSPATVASAGGRYYGFVVGGALPAALAANWLAAAWDQNAGTTVLSPVAAALESITQNWLLDLLALPAESGVGFVTGATMANLSALAAARHAVLARAGWDVEANGLFGAPPITVVVGDEVHVSVLKALSVLGLGRERIVRVPVDGQGRMRPEALPALNGPTIVCLQTGNVNSGACDPVDELCAIAHDSGAWVHVDGAFGLWLAAAPARAHLVHGLANADSWATDAHKWLNVPYDSGLVICRQPEHLRAAMSVSAAYLEQQDARGEPYQYTPEMSRRARGVEVWAALRALGRAGVADLIERSCRYATRFAEGLHAAGYQVLNEVSSNQVLVAFGDADTTRKVIAAIQSEGICWCGGTVWQGQAAMRISISSWATTEEDVEQSLAAMLRNAAMF
ncbi:MAG: aminotransferase class V-fold PLP-dependent enzyme [Roseiflexaceae bacterium]